MDHVVSNAIGKVSRNRRIHHIIVGLIFLTVILAFVIVPIEAGFPGSRINTVEDGLWWAISTVTGVTYGDIFPVTHFGKVISMFLGIVGLVLFGSVVAIISVELLRYQEDFYVRRMFTRIDALENKLDDLKKQLGYLVKK